MSNNNAFYTLNANNALVHQSILDHVQTEFAKTAMFDKGEEKYKYTENGMAKCVAGLKTHISQTFHPFYKESDKKRAYTTQIRGSSSKEGQRVDRELKLLTSQSKEKNKKHGKLSPKTLAIWNYWKELKHVVQGSQIPIRIHGNTCMTQVDVITKAPDGKLWLWEIKCGCPIGLHRQVKKMCLQNVVNLDGKPIKCTKKAMWQLQVYYCYLSLKAAGIPIAEYRILQVFTRKKQKAIQFKEHLPAPWLKNIKIVDDRMKWNPKVIVKKKKQQEREYVFSSSSSSEEKKDEKEKDDKEDNRHERKRTVFDEKVYSPQLIRKRQKIDEEKEK